METKVGSKPGDYRLGIKIKIYEETAPEAVLELAPGKEPRARDLMLARKAVRRAYKQYKYDFYAKIKEKEGKDKKLNETVEKKTGKEK